MIGRTLLAASLVACALPAAAQTLAIVHARTWTMTANAPVEDATILIDERTIVSVVPGGAVPSGVRTIDATGKLVTPGLVNAASQIGLVEVSSAPDTRDTSDKGPLGASFDVSRALNGNSALVSLARADGMTRGVSFPAASSSIPFAGLAAMVRLRDGADILDRAAVAEFVVIGGTSENRSRAAQWQRLREALGDVRQKVAAGMGVEGDLAPLGRVLGGELPLAIMTNRESDVRQAIGLVRDFGVRAVIVGGAEAWRVASELAAAHIMVVVDSQANLPETFDRLGLRQDNAAILARAGVPIAFGMVGGKLEYNYNAGLNLREDAGLAVAAGLPYRAALEALTVNPLGAFGIAGGKLEAGAEADLVIWDGDPLELSTNALAVIVEGRESSLENRQSRLVDRYAPPVPR
ncbi:amidohydrolase family protein [Sphingomonas lycopersici]|uniref:amidohydrolase family protein n=1 Tax=Sphingomonas lycopersici TaxID=2951807 RepID=UPI0022371B83|nr:amidohydrolase family protein [Sphingomonas lycopersici]